ncbi:MAG: hypothetical protein WCP31_05135 [Chloroflexales bacterium]
MTTAASDPEPISAFIGIFGCPRPQDGREPQQIGLRLLRLLQTSSEHQ